MTATSRSVQPWGQIALEQLEEPLLIVRRVEDQVVQGV
jgi:hypothetical protein